MGGSRPAPSLCGSSEDVRHRLRFPFATTRCGNARVVFESKLMAVTHERDGILAISGEAGRRRDLLRSASTGDVDEGDLLVARSVEAHNRFRRRLQDYATTLLVKIRARFRR